jgi:hypothetical protein
MHCELPRLFLTTVIFLVGVRVLADETLPAPRPVPAPIIYPPAFSPRPYYRKSAYEVWQYYGVDRQGRFVPRVVRSPYGDYFYLYNGVPYTWTTSHQLDFMPYAVD